MGADCRHEQENLARCALGQSNNFYVFLLYPKFQDKVPRMYLNAKLKVKNGRDKVEDAALQKHVRRDVTRLIALGVGRLNQHVRTGLILKLN